MLVFDAAYCDEDYPSLGLGAPPGRSDTKRQSPKRQNLALSGFNPGVVDADLDAIKAQVERLEGETIIATESQTYLL